MKAQSGASCVPSREQAPVQAREPRCSEPQTPSVMRRICEIGTIGSTFALCGSATRAMATWTRSILCARSIAPTWQSSLWTTPRVEGWQLVCVRRCRGGVCGGPPRVRRIQLLRRTRDRAHNWSSPRFEPRQDDDAVRPRLVNGTKWRDIMSYKESCGGCPRLPIWPGPIVMVRGEPAGSAELDNVRVIREQAARVAAFR